MSETQYEFVLNKRHPGSYGVTKSWITIEKDYVLSATQAIYDPLSDHVTLPDGSKMSAEAWLDANDNVNLPSGVPTWNPYNSTVPDKEATGCAAGLHDFKRYIGLSEVFDYCTKCDEKKEVKE